MMASKGIARVGQDKHVGHASPTPNPFHQTPYVEGASTVIINGTPAVRVGDKTSCGDIAQSGAPTVIIQGVPAHRIGDATSGHGSWGPNTCATGSPNVLA